VLVAPLAALAVAWTSHQTLIGTTSADVRPLPATAVAPGSPVTLPETSDAIEAPASLSGAVRADSRTTGSTSRVTAGSTAAPGDIPAAALSAYQRAESIINAADEGCGVSWQLIAAIGSVESDHGRYNGSVLDDQGRAAPAILGPVLDGGPGMATIRDTDAGQYDGDEAYDRAVGPLQFIPSTWAVAGVDADDDGRRDPQDIDDAALAAAVYLCSGSEDLSTRAGQEAAVHRYNHSDAYVDLVLSRAGSYLEGDAVGGGGYTSVVNAGSVVPLTPLASAPVRSARERGGVAGGAARAYRDAARVFLGATAAADLRDGADPLDAADAAAPGSDTARTAARTARRSGAEKVDGPVRRPAGAQDAAKPADPAKPAGPAGPVDPAPEAGPGAAAPADPAPEAAPTAPAPAGAPTPAAPPVPAPTPEELADTACDEQGLVDDETLDADDHDVCVAEELGLPAPVDPEATTDPSPESTEPDA